MTIAQNVKTEKGIANLKQAGNDFKSVAESKATDIANNLGSKVGEYVGDAGKYLNEASEVAGKYLSQASSSVKDAGNQLETSVQERPFVAIAATLGLGVILGMLLRK